MDNTDFDFNEYKIERNQLEQELINGKKKISEEIQRRKKEIRKEL